MQWDWKSKQAFTGAYDLHLGELGAEFPPAPEGLYASDPRIPGRKSPGEVLDEPPAQPKAERCRYQITQCKREKPRVLEDPERKWSSSQTITRAGFRLQCLRLGAWSQKVGQDRKEYLLSQPIKVDRLSPQVNKAWHRLWKCKEWTKSPTIWTLSEQFESLSRPSYWDRIYLFSWRRSNERRSIRLKEEHEPGYRALSWHEHWHG